MNISAASGPIIGVGKNCIRLCYRSDLVSMATNSSNRVVMGKTVLPFFLLVFHSIFFILAYNEDKHESSKEYDVWSDLTTDC